MQDVYELNQNKPAAAAEARHLFAGERAKTFGPNVCFSSPIKSA
jgi:hypothetical protein